MTAAVAAAGTPKVVEATPRTRSSASRVAYRVVSITTMAFVIVAALLAGAYLMGFRFYVVVSGSMTPAMPTGSLCVVRETYPFDGVTTGDIVAFRTESGDVTTHRVSAVTSRGLITKGDANADADAAPVTRVGYAGRAVWYAAGLGRVVELLLSPVGVGVIVVAVLALLVAELALKRAADVEDAADAEIARRDIDADAINAAVAQTAADAVHAAMSEYLFFYDGRNNVAGGPAAPRTAPASGGANAREGGGHE